MSESPAEPQGASGSLGKELELRASCETGIEQLNRVLRVIASVSQAIAEESERAPLADRVCAFREERGGAAAAARGVSRRRGNAALRCGGLEDRGARIVL